MMQASRQRPTANWTLNSTRYGVSQPVWLKAGLAAAMGYGQWDTDLHCPHCCR